MDLEFESMLKETPKISIEEFFTRKTNTDQEIIKFTYSYQFVGSYATFLSNAIKRHDSSLIPYSKRKTFNTLLERYIDTLSSIRDRDDDYFREFLGKLSQEDPGSLEVLSKINEIQDQLIVFIQELSPTYPETNHYPSYFLILNDKINEEIKNMEQDLDRIL